MAPVEQSFCRVQGATMAPVEQSLCLQFTWHTLFFTGQAFRALILHRRLARVAAYDAVSGIRVVLASVAASTRRQLASPALVLLSSRPSLSSSVVAEKFSSGIGCHSTPAFGERKRALWLEALCASPV